MAVQEFVSLDTQFKENNMAHFALVNSGKVEKVIVAEQDFIDNLTEQYTGKYIQTSFNTIGGEHILGGTPFRKNFAEVGGTYDKSRDAFIPVKPHLSWVLNEDSCRWEAPVAHPNDDNMYTWNETTQTWDEVA